MEVVWAAPPTGAPLARQGRFAMAFGHPLTREPLRALIAGERTAQRPARRIRAAQTKRSREGQDPTHGNGNRSQISRRITCSHATFSVAQEDSVRRRYPSTPQCDQPSGPGYAVRRKRAIRAEVCRISRRIRCPTRQPGPTARSHRGGSSRACRAGLVDAEHCHLTSRSFIRRLGSRQTRPIRSCLTKLTTGQASPGRREKTGHTYDYA